MVLAASRRDFLTGAVRREHSKTIRPPGASLERFSDQCDSCGACVTSCPENILVPDVDGKPIVDPTRGACTFCGDCAEACPTDALSVDRISDWPWRARISDTCLSLNGVTCRSCQDACEARAIRFQLEPGGRSSPVLDKSQCTGCAACAFICPAQAVSLVMHDPAKREAQT